MASGIRPGGTDESRWKGIVRPYHVGDVERLRGSVPIVYTLATLGAKRLWRLLESEPFVPSLGAMTGTQAVQMVAGGLPAIYASGWQVAADANTAAETYPDQSLYPVDSMPALVRRINHAFRREDEKQHALGKGDVHWYAPILADAEAGFGGTLNVFELTKSLIDAGVSGLHLEDQLASVKKCGHMGGKVLVPAREFNQKLWAARLAADIVDVPTVLLARTDALSAKLLTSDVDPRDAPFLTGKRTPEGFFEITGGLDMAIARGLAYAPYADLLWFETAGPDLDEAERFAREVHREFPGKLLGYNCSPSFNWRKKLPADTIAEFQQTIAEMGYRFQFVTLAGFHALNLSMFRLAKGYARTGMTAYSELQEEEFRAEAEGYAAVKHQSFVGAGYFDDVSQVLSGGLTTTLAMEGSTEQEQFGGAHPPAADAPAGDGRRASAKRASPAGGS
ncbi:MAG TPA: isocitrate lyase [Thermoplasmata archaeon]|nr:isocitrate lyase [Thermoplasmata archaeon]HTW56386.1 isocitrate lyase [Thermoplasmata archaeon]